MDSLLDVGGGDDQVSIATWLEPAWPVPLEANLAAGTDDRDADLQKIALLDSVVILGDGDDQLSVDGAVIGSRLDLGSGSNGLQITGRLEDSSVALAPDSSNAIRLGDGDDGLTITLASGEQAVLHLDTAAGDDLILLPLEGLSGSIDGGAGHDTLRNGSESAPLAVSLDGPGTGTLGALGFRNLETLFLGDGGSLVSVGAQGSLEGVLEAGSGVDGLDYAAWQEPVTVDLGRGEASGILGGILGFEEVRGGSGNDRLIAAADTVRLDGGEGDDEFDLDLSAPSTAWTSADPPLVVIGGLGRDRFVLAGMEAIRTMAAGSDGVLPVLADLAFSPDTGNGIGLTDLVSWRQGGVLLGGDGDGGVVDLTPAGLEGIGQPRLLPIAPLQQLVAGIGARTTGMDQLAIATGEMGSRLVLLGSDRSITAIADLPGLRSVSSIPDPGAIASGLAA
ncbi:hypothetical protein [Synechococcus sp. CCY 9618]|uniref:hypothetical protein n=1 Tax=Synechococcus sp. CCY 9618 TaxID=2815602 RepID=UPI001C24F096|nr:hypothetical protein [Synechococcus sp. CCY 9618]